MTKGIVSTFEVINNFLGGCNFPFSARFPFCVPEPSGEAEGPGEEHCAGRFTCLGGNTAVLLKVCCVVASVCPALFENKVSGFLSLQRNILAGAGKSHFPQEVFFSEFLEIHRDVL